MPRRIARMGAARGLLGGSRPWLALWAVTGAFKMLAKLFRKEPKVVYCEDLQPGESLVITHLTHRVR